MYFQEKDFTIDTLPAALHQRCVDWQKRYFPEYDYLVGNWSKHYKHTPFQLVAKLSPLPTDEITVGRMKGRKRFAKAGELDDEMIQATAKIIKAQCSTELGSIQQHRGSLQKSQDPKLQFDILRVMAEEFRHAYQMLYVLASDDWSRVGKDIASETMDHLLSMETGGHVLDAFNLYFDSFVDNISFCSIIDRVGKYQLEMQTVFSYSPMARSMFPMLYEEAFHMATGVNPQRQWVKDWLADRGNVSVETLQKHINKWVPRGMEMFGDERGGKTVVDFGFKDKLNGDAMMEYHREVKSELIDSLNWEILKAKVRKDLPRDEAVKHADRILATGESWKGVKPEELVFLPSEKFYRRRGVHEFEMYDLRGNPIPTPKAWLHYLRTHLPEPYVSGPDFKKYVENFTAKQAGKDVHEEGLPFYG
jgi:1,2-phenylacetyl-CoA epoxidase catalytic subunit